MLLDSVPADPDTVFKTEILPKLDRLRPVALRLTRRDVALTEDLLQTVALRAWLYRASFHPGTNAASWLLTILRNEFLRDRTSKRTTCEHPTGDANVDLASATAFGVASRRLPAAADAGHRVTTAQVDPRLAQLVSDASYGRDLDHDLDSERAVAAVDAALPQLSDDYREIWLLREREDLSYAEIAKRLRLPMGTVMSRLHRARKQLESLLVAAAA